MKTHTMLEALMMPNLSTNLKPKMITTTELEPKLPTHNHHQSQSLFQEKEALLRKRRKTLMCHKLKIVKI